MDKRLLEALESEKPEPLAGRPKWVKTFLYGEYGTGKTILACSLVIHKGLLIATDTGTDSIYNHPELLDKIDVLPYRGLSQLTAIAQAIEEGHPDYIQYDTIIIDTISQVQEEYIDWLGENFKYSGNHRVVAEPRKPGPNKSSMEIVGLPDYRLARDHMRGPIKSLIKAPVHVHFLAHLREPTMMDEQKGKLVRRPTLTEAVFKLIAVRLLF